MSPSSIRAAWVMILLGLLFGVATSNSAMERQAQGEDSACGKWYPYKKEKCLIRIPGKHTYAQAVDACKKLAKEGEGDTPTPIIIKSQEKQDFVNNRYLYQVTVDGIWLGMWIEDDAYQWIDGTEMAYNNGITSVDPKYRCAVLERRVWRSERCNTNAEVICERNQKKIEVDINTLISNLKEEVERANERLTNLERNPVPIGFIYVQLPEHNPPATLWPQVEFKDVSAQYAGLFFRAEGGDSAAFGKRQIDQNRRILEVFSTFANRSQKRVKLLEGEWSPHFYTGGDGPGYGRGLSFFLSTGENRPLNTAVRIWQRVK